MGESVWGMEWRLQGGRGKSRVLGRNSYLGSDLVGLGRLKEITLLKFLRYICLRQREARSEMASRINVL